MVSRFQIEDMVAQDASGVVFRALDSETGLLVAVRRFFPFGVNGGGLSMDEQADYDIAVGRLADIKHPAMRAIICGGCDPVDGMPFIATEWIEGSAVQSYLEQGPLSPDETIHMITQALEVCELISQVFGQEAVWVETDVHTIIVGAEGSGRGLTFWMSPLKWLGKNDGQRGLDAIVTLTEDSMGWRGKTILDHEGGGLGGWLKWLRSSARKSTLSEARESLLATSSTAPPIPVKRAVRQATRSTAITLPKRKSGLPFLAGGIAALVAISLGGWTLIRWNNSRLTVTPPAALIEGMDTQPPPEKEQSRVSPQKNETTAKESPSSRESQPRRKRTTEQMNADAAEMLVAAQKSDAESAIKTAAQNAKIASRNGVFTVEDSELFLAMHGEKVILRGTLKGFASSGSGKTLYLHFSESPPNFEVRGAIATSTPHDELSQTKLTSLLDKSIRLEGKIYNERNGNVKRPTIKIVNRNAIQEDQ